MVSRLHRVSPAVRDDEQVCSMIRDGRSGQAVVEWLLNLRHSVPKSTAVVFVTDAHTDLSPTVPTDGSQAS